MRRAKNKDMQKGEWNWRVIGMGHTIVPILGTVKLFPWSACDMQGNSISAVGIT